MRRLLSSVNCLGLSPCLFLTLDPSSIGSLSVLVVWRAHVFHVACCLCLSRAGDDALRSSCCHGRDLSCAEFVSFFCLGVLFVCDVVASVVLLSARLPCM